MIDGWVYFLRVHWILINVFLLKGFFPFSMVLAPLPPSRCPHPLTLSFYSVFVSVHRWGEEFSGGHFLSQHTHGYANNEKIQWKLYVFV